MSKYSLNSSHAGKFLMFLMSSVDNFKINFFKKFFQEHYQREQSDHTVCFHDKIKSEVHLNICSRHRNKKTFSGQKNFGWIRV